MAILIEARYNAGSWENIFFAGLSPQVGWPFIDESFFPGVGLERGWGGGGRVWRVGEGFMRKSGGEKDS